MTASASCALVCVDPAQLDAIWPHVLPLIESAFAERGDDTPESIKADLDAGEALLWIIWDGSELLAAGVTKIMPSARRKVFRIVCWAGRDVARWIDLIAQLEAYGRSQGCNVCRIEGRPGWKRLLPEYREPHVVLEKAL